MVVNRVCCICWLWHMFPCCSSTLELNYFQRAQTLAWSKLRNLRIVRKAKKNMEREVEIGSQIKCAIRRKRNLYVLDGYIVAHIHITRTHWYYVNKREVFLESMSSPDNQLLQEPPNQCGTHFELFFHLKTKIRLSDRITFAKFVGESIERKEIIRQILQLPYSEGRGFVLN